MKKQYHWIQCPGSEEIGKTIGHTAKNTYSDYDPGYISINHYCSENLIIAGL